MSLWRRHYHRHVRHHHRFNIAVALTILAVSYVVVPFVEDFVHSVGTYNPAEYEPKDVERGVWLARRSAVAFGEASWDNVVKILLLVLAGVAWLAIGPSGSSGRGSRR